MSQLNESNSICEATAPWRLPDTELGGPGPRVRTNFRSRWRAQNPRPSPSEGHGEGHGEGSELEGWESLEGESKGLDDGGTGAVRDAFAGMKAEGDPQAESPEKKAKPEIEKNVEVELTIKSKTSLRSQRKICFSNGSSSNSNGTIAQKRKLSMAPPPLPTTRKRCNPEIPRSLRLPFDSFTAHVGPSWWTSRVQLAVTYAAGLGAALLLLQGEHLENGRPGKDFWGFKHLPQRVQEQGAHKSFLRGMAELARIVNIVCRSEPPLAGVVMQVVSPLSSMRGKLGIQEQHRHSLSHFFGKGGQPEQVLSAIVDEAEAFCEACTNEDLNDSTDSIGCALSQSDWASCYRSLPHREADQHFESLRKRLCGTFAGELC